MERINFDTIIIGSGAGGLAAAICLSRAGQRVLVLEQHYVAGGSTHCFEDKNWEFDTGIHYIGNIKSRNKVLNLIMDKSIDWIPLGYDNDLIYDNIIIHNNSMVSGIKIFHFTTIISFHISLSQ